jgi:pyridoxine 5-phosphate synthase
MGLHMVSSHTTALSVNVNKIAVLRNSRGGTEPDVLQAARACIEAGCQGITVHPRPDARHIRPADVLALAAVLPEHIEFNIEGNPFAPASGAYPGLLALIKAARPAQATLVPDGDGQLTSDHGFDLVGDQSALREHISAIRALGVRVSLFVDEDVSLESLERARELGADRIEIYTGPYAERHLLRPGSAAAQACASLAQRARSLGLNVNAGHDLSQHNLADLLRAAPQIAEVSIGHALIGEALYEGLHQTVQRYLALIAMVQAERGS